MLTALKKAEAGDALVVRVVEMEGKSTEISVQLLGAPQRLQPVNLLEEAAGGGTVERLRLGPHEIGTVRVSITAK